MEEQTNTHIWLMNQSGNFEVLTLGNFYQSNQNVWLENYLIFKTLQRNLDTISQGGGDGNSWLLFSASTPCLTLHNEI